MCYKGVPNVKIRCALVFFLLFCKKGGRCVVFQKMPPYSFFEDSEYGDCDGIKPKSVAMTLLLVCYLFP